MTPRELSRPAYGRCTTEGLRRWAGLLVGSLNGAISGNARGN